jgi:hypothetical protein
MRCFPIAVLTACCTLASAASDIDLPARKPGLWQYTHTTDRTTASRPSTVTMLCTDESFGQEMLQMGSAMQQQMCSRRDMRREGNRVITQSVCKFGDTTISSNGVATFSGDTAFRMEMHATYAPALMGMKEGNTVVEAKWLGACKAGQKPGDMTLPGGQTVNLRHMGTPQ